MTGGRERPTLAFNSGGERKEGRRDGERVKEREEKTERAKLQSAHRDAGACHLPLLLVFSIPGVVGRRRLLELARLESEEDASLADTHVTNQDHLVRHGVG